LNWATDILASPGVERDRVLEYPMSGADPSVAYYEQIGGAHFRERSAVGYAFSSLDTPVYHEYLKAFFCDDRDAVIVDVGGGDGRNAQPWLEHGFTRVVVVDPVSAALRRFRDWVAGNHPEWLDRILLIRADARALPLRDGVAGRVLAIESLCYLNEDEALGVAECARVLAPEGRFLIAERDWEGALLVSLLYYGGVEGMLRLGQGRDMWDGVGAARVRSRVATEEEVRRLLAAAGLVVESVSGVSGFSVVLGFLRPAGQLSADPDARLPELRRLLLELGASGRFRRAHVAVARHERLIPEP